MSDAGWPSKLKRRNLKENMDWNEATESARKMVARQKAEIAAAPKASEPSRVRSGDWVDALAIDWARNEIFAQEQIGQWPQGSIMHSALSERITCLQKHRAEMVRASTGGSEASQEARKT